MNAKHPQRAGEPNSRRGALIGLVVALVLLVVGLTLVYVLRGQGQLEDCLMSGRTNCAPIDSTAAGR